MLLIPYAMLGQVCQFFASEITGPSNACAHVGNRGQVATYSVNATDASAFAWILPAQATLLSGQGTNRILVRYRIAFMEGAISVQISNACGGAGTSRTIQIGKVSPDAPPSMDGPSLVCDVIDAGVPVTYTIPVVPGATQYRWSVPTYATLVSGQGTNSIQILYSSKFRTGNIRVRSISACGASANLVYGVNWRGPGRPGAIAGQNRGICGDNNIIEYNIAPVRNASSYSWTTDVPGAVIDNQGTKAIINFPAFSTGAVNVSAAGLCLISGVRSLAVSSRGFDPDSVSGPTLVCEGAVQTFSVDSVAGATLYNWTVPEGFIINSGNGSASINVTIGPNGGAVTVRASTACDGGAPVSKEVQVDEECVPEPPDCKLTIFPNPTSGLLNLNWCAVEDGCYHIYVTDAITGCVLYCKMGKYQAGDNSISADVSNLKDGYYILYVTTNEFKHNERIEVKH